MKTLKSLITGVCLFLACTAAKANTNTKDDRTATPNTALETYINAIGHGDVKNLDQVIDESATFSMLRGKNVVSYDKNEILNFYNESKGHEQNCVIRTSFVNRSATVTIARVDMKYENFVRSNYVTLSRVGNSWKITNVYSVFS